MSLIEVMIVMTIMSLIGLGTATLMKNMFSIQKRSSLKNIAEEIRNNLETVLKNDTAWGFSVNNNASLNCLRDNVGSCAETLFNGNTTSPNAGFANNINVWDANGAAWYNAAGAAIGFRADNGNVCNTYNGAGGSGNDVCPFKYTLRIYSECPGATVNCDKPQITVLGLMTFNPQDPSDPRNKLNVDDYIILFQRGERVRYEPLEIIYSENDSSGGGDCTANTWVPRPVSSINYDVGGNATITNGPLGQFRLQPGTYECKIIAQGYEALDGFSIRLRNITAGTNLGVVANAFSGWNSSAFATGTIQLQLASASVMQFQHFCSNDNLPSPGDGSDHAYPPGPCSECEMGIPVPGGGGGYGGGSGAIYTTINCIRSS